MQKGPWYNLVFECIFSIDRDNSTIIYHDEKVLH